MLIQVRFVYKPDDTVSRFQVDRDSILTPLRCHHAKNGAFPLRGKVAEARAEALAARLRELGIEL